MIRCAISSATTRAKRACVTWNAKSPTCRAKSVKDILVKKLDNVHITRRNLEKYAGVKRFRFGEVEPEDLVGVTTGLAWTEVGGELLSIEAVALPGKGKIITTGKLGDVMKESVQAAESYVKSRALAFGIKPTLLEKRDIHVHVPEGATPEGWTLAPASPWSPPSSRS